MSGNEITHDLQSKSVCLEGFVRALSDHEECTGDLQEALRNLEGEALTHFIHTMKAALKLPRCWIVRVRGNPRWRDGAFEYSIDGFFPGWRAPEGWGTDLMKECRRDAVYKYPNRREGESERTVIIIDGPGKEDFCERYYDYVSARAFTHKKDAEKWAAEERDRLNVRFNRSTASR